MPGQNEWLTIRRLPGGEVRPGCMVSREGDRLELTLLSEAGGRDRGMDALVMGALVEVECEQVVYLGEVLRRDAVRQGVALTIAIEHTVDRSTVAAIQDTWSAPQGA